MQIVTLFYAEFRLKNSDFNHKNLECLETWIGLLIMPEGVLLLWGLTRGRCDILVCLVRSCLLILVLFLLFQDELLQQVTFCILCFCLAAVHTVCCLQDSHPRQLLVFRAEPHGLSTGKITPTTGTISEQEDNTCQTDDIRTSYKYTYVHFHLCSTGATGFTSLLYLTRDTAIRIL